MNKEEIVHFYNIEDGQYYQSRYTHKYLEKLQQENKQLKDNWNKLKEWLNTFHKLSEFEQWEIVNKIKELEKSGSNGQ